MNWKNYFLISLCCLNLSACLERPQEILKIGSHWSIGYEPLYLARSLGFLPPSQVRLIDYPSSHEASLSFRNNLIDGLMTTLDEAVGLLPFVPNMRVILVLNASEGADALIAQPYLTQLEHLKGMKIGIDNTTLSHFLLQNALASVGLSSHNISLVYLNFTEHNEAFVSQQIDAIVSSSSNLPFLEEKNGVNLFNSRHLPNQILSVLVVRDNILQNRKEIWKIVKEVWFKGLHFMTTQKENTILYVASRKQISQKLAIQLINNIKFFNEERNYYYLSGKIPRLQQQAEVFADWMTFNNYISQPIPHALITSLPTNEILP
jgi:NitT/TauT family transport system substrate-binding protein